MEVRVSSVGFADPRATRLQSLAVIRELRVFVIAIRSLNGRIAVQGLEYCRELVSPAAQCDVRAVRVLEGEDFTYKWTGHVGPFLFISPTVRVANSPRRGRATSL